MIARLSFSGLDILRGMRYFLAFLSAALLLAACSSDSNSPAGTPSSTGTSTATATITAAAVTPTARPTFPPVPVTTPPADPVILPADDAAHRYYTEWWYFTGHLDSATDRKTYGFEFVIFQVRVSPLAPPFYISHFAVTDPDASRPFLYEYRSALGEQPAPSRGVAFDVDGWRLTAYDGNDTIQASMASAAIDVALKSEKPAMLHGGAGLLPFAGAGWTYYYTRPRLAVTGTLTVDGVEQQVTGDAWFDHQWGDFDPTFGDGGWDWTSAQLEDGSELMAVVLYDNAGTAQGGFASYVDPGGNETYLDAKEFSLRATGSWTSPRTNVTYPSGWHITVASLGLDLAYAPVRPDQELDVRQSTGNIYWEGAVDIAGTRGTAPIAGRGYVELTGYDTRKAP